MNPVGRIYAVLSDTTPPSITIAGPTNAATCTTSLTSIPLSGTASDNSSVSLSDVTWATNRGERGTASGTTAWNSGPIALKRGTNVITVTAHDAAGHVATDTLTVTRDRI